MQDWHTDWTEVIHEAHFRAALTGWRYRVTLEPNNHLWEMRKTHKPIARRQ